MRCDEDKCVCGYIHVCMYMYGYMCEYVCECAGGSVCGCLAIACMQFASLAVAGTEKNDNRSKYRKNS